MSVVYCSRVSVRQMGYLSVVVAYVCGLLLTGCGATYPVLAKVEGALQPTKLSAIKSNVFACSNSMAHPEPSEGVQVYIPYVANAPGYMTIRTDGFLTIGEEPFFPFGLYHTSWAGRVHEDLRQDVGAVSDAGFSFLHAAMDTRDGAVLELADYKGVWLFVANNDVRGLEAMIKQFPQQFIIAGWLLSDDFNSPPDNPQMSPEELCERHRLVKSLDPYRLTYASGGAPPAYELAPYRDAVDVIGIQSYPISNKSMRYQSELEQNYSQFCHARQALADKTLLANTQAFRWPDESARYPTPAEERNLTYAALMNGVNGILAYAYYDGNHILSQSDPVLWEEMIQLNVDVQQLKQVLVNGDRIELITEPCSTLFNEATVHATAWQWQDELYIAALNTHDSQTLPIQFELPMLTYGDLQPVFGADARYEQGLVREESRITGQISPQAVHLYRLSTKPVQ
ncbi:MAG: hypothetical protein R3C14_49630 [Caldilineaceae bacterium]